MRRSAAALHAGPRAGLVRMAGRPEICIDRRSLLLGRILPGNEARSKEQAYTRRFLRQINVDRCVGCDVCTRICPPGAMRLERRGQQAFYLIEPGLCDGCGICLELCEAGAIDMADRTPATRPQLVSLLTLQCRRCGVPFHLPRMLEGEETLCRICAAREPWSS